MNKPASFTFTDLQVGQAAQFEIELTEDLLDDFSKVSGDYSPLHMDETFARTTPLGGRVAHGILGASFISQLIGMRLPGKNALYLSQELFFRAPLRLGMDLLIRGTVMQKVDAMRTIKLKTEVLNKENLECLIDGEALVKLLA